MASYIRNISMLLLLAAANAFVQSSLARNRWMAPATSLHAESAAAASYAAAEEASRKFGVGSKEAALAWEAVNDIENGGGAINPEIMAAGIDTNYETSGAGEHRCRELEKSMEHLADLTSVAKSINTQIKSEILKLESLKLGTSVQQASRSLNTEAYAEAKAAAEAATLEYGAQSKEARVAWEAVFEVVSASDDAAVNMGSLEDECLVSSSAKCADYHMAMDELRNAIIHAEATEFNKSI